MKKTIFLATVATALAQCKTPATKAVGANADSATIATADNSRNSLDWKGTYTGAVPCADCEGIQTSLSLNEGNTYVLRTVYLGKSTAVNESKGGFEWNAAGNTITLKGADANAAATMYAVGENAVTQLDLQGNKITGANAEKYVLKKTMYNAALNRYWKLTELNGQPVSPATGRAEAHLIFHPDGRVSGSGGCNRLTGSYTLNTGNRITLSQMASTRMTCPGMSTEAAFLKALGNVDNYAVNGDSLSLQKAGMAPAARFVAVEMK